MDSFFDKYLGGRKTLPELPCGKAEVNEGDENE